MHIVLVPGLWLDASSWNDVVTRLAEAGHRATALTLRGLDSRTSNRAGMMLADHVAEIVAAIDAEHPLQPVEAQYRGEVANRWRYRDGIGEIGVIASVTQPFCGDCTRARLSAEGKLHTCLFATTGHDLRALVRGGASDAARPAGKQAPTEIAEPAPPLSLAA